MMLYGNPKEWLIGELKHGLSYFLNSTLNLHNETIKHTGQSEQMLVSHLAA